MALVRHPSIQTANGKYLEMADVVTAVTNRDTEDEATAYVDEEASAPVSYPVSSGAEGELDIWVPVGAYETEFANDVVDTPAVWEAISGAEIANMLTTEDIPGFPAVVSPLDFGCDPTGITPCTTEMQAALSYVAANGGKLDLGYGSYLIDAPGLVLNASAQNFEIVGDTPGNITSGRRGAAFMYRGEPGDPSLLELNGIANWAIRNVHFQYDGNYGFDGDLVFLTGSAISGDCANWIVDNCSSSCMVANTNTDAPRTARSIFLLFRCIIGYFDGCSIGGADNGIRFATGLFNNAIQIRNCTFNHCSDAQIFLGSPDLENLVIDSCAFEAGGADATPGPATGFNPAIKGGSIANGDPANVGLYSFVLRNCWFGDASGSLETDWVESLRQLGGPGLIMGNAFRNDTNSGAFLDLINGQWLLIGNEFHGGGGGSVDSIIRDGVNIERLIAIGNEADSVAGMVQPGATDVPYTAYWGFGNNGACWPGPAIPGSLTVGGTGNIAQAVLDRAGPNLVLGKYAGTPVPTGTAGKSIISNDGGDLQLQSWDDGDAKSVKLIVGATPTTVIEGQAPNKVGFHGATASAKQTITGSRGGNAALADLLTKLASKGLITDSTSA